MKVLYGVFGYVELSISLLGQRVTFKGGAVNSIGMRPATFETDNKALQEAIEESPRYKKGVIKVIARKEVAKPVENPANAVPEVTNLQGARQYLMANGFELKDVATKADVLEAAKKLNITFPNWK